MFGKNMEIFESCNITYSKSVAGASYIFTKDCDETNVVFLIPKEELKSQT